MKRSSLIITQLPSSLWNSPIYEAYDYYVDDGLDTLERDIEEMFHLTDVKAIQTYTDQLRMKMLMSGYKKLDLDGLIGFKRLVNAAAYTGYPVDAMHWLLRLTNNVQRFSHVFDDTGLEIMSYIGETGVIIGPLSTTSPSWA